MKTDQNNPPDAICLSYKEFSFLVLAMNRASGIAEVAAERDHFLKRDVRLIRRAEKIMAKVENLVGAKCVKTIKYTATSKKP